jgi:hypothetical protein
MGYLDNGHYEHWRPEIEKLLRDMWVIQRQLDVPDPEDPAVLRHWEKLDRVIPLGPRNDEFPP